jgi:hypothetical protein
MLRGTTAPTGEVAALETYLVTVLVWSRCWITA